MAYSNFTNKYLIPTLGSGDLIDPSQETRAKQIVDNQLFGSVRALSSGHGIVRSGVLQLVNNQDGTYSVWSTESKATGKPSIEAFINQIYVYQDTNISWSGLINGSTYYLYITQVESSTQSSLQNKQVATSSNTTGVIPSNGLLVAIIILNEPGNSIFINSPTGKTTIPILGDHIVNNQNPHTPFLNQNNLTVSGLNVLRLLNYKQLQVDSLYISGNSIISGNIYCLGQLVVSGTIFNNGNVTYNYLNTTNLTVPGSLIASNLIISSGIDIYGTALFRQNVQLTSGVTIGGLDPTLCIPLINGSNADRLHGHTLGSLGFGTKPIYFAPEYQNTTISGPSMYNNLSGVLSTLRTLNNNYYTWYSVQSGISAIPITQMILPQDFGSIDRIEVRNGVGYLGSGNSITTTVLDKDQNICPVSPNNGVMQNLTITKSTLTVSGGQFVPQNPMTIVNTMIGASGIATYLGDMVVWYVPIGGEKLMFDWNVSGAGVQAQTYYDGMRVAPATMRLEKILASQVIGLSGNTVFGINWSMPGQLPTSIFQGSPKPTLSFGTVGASFQGTTITPTGNVTISGGTILTADLDLVASGSSTLSLQLIGYRI